MNDLRGEVKIVIGNREVTLRMTFQVMRIIEKRFGKTITEICNEAICNNLRPEEISVVLEELLKDHFDGDLTMLPKESERPKYEEAVKAVLFESLGGNENLIFPDIKEDIINSVNLPELSNITNAEEVGSINEIPEELLEANDNSSTEIPWENLIRIATGKLGLMPEVFWNMTAKEFISAYQGYQQEHTDLQVSVPADYPDLIRLMNQFPDKKKQNPTTEQVQ